MIPMEGKCELSYLKCTNPSLQLGSLRPRLKSHWSLGTSGVRKVHELEISERPSDLYSIYLQFEHCV